MAQRDTSTAPAQRPIRVVLADDHVVLRQGLRTLLAGHEGIDVVGEASDGREAVELVDRLRPDILIADLRMPGLGGLEVTQRVRATIPETRVLILSMYAGRPYVVEALEYGAAGYVLKNTDIDNLLHAVRQVAAGRRYLSPQIEELLLDTYLKQVSERAADPYETLTRRERQVLRLVASGATTADIAEQLGISPRTAAVHRQRMTMKLNLKTHADLVLYALQRGLIDAPDTE